MLNPTLFAALAPLSPRTIKLFCQLWIERDLSSPCALDPHVLAERHGISTGEARRGLRELHQAGVLTQGPHVRGARGDYLVSTYRLSREFYLFTKEQEEREALSVPSGNGSSVYIYKARARGHSGASLFPRPLS